MRLIKKYIPPSPQALEKLKLSLGLSNKDMADLADVSSSGQFRKYLSNSDPRKMSAVTLFYIASQLCLTPEQIDTVLNRMTEIGAEIDTARPE
ncbi:transcriptional regulator [Pantoea coffeiphila]|uniref:Transcriptional regulator n=1 Tax=Pantoea coffeiphila TaxID=1465635 RepID=A0A2S9I7A4_9GAMM|nr:transcriptional regulator [Pantoea coffeiphila]PRD13670.1 transcriptional regulator [Pantoea coffeiphila]